MHVYRMREVYGNAAICAGPKAVRWLKDQVKNATGNEPKNPLFLFGCPVYEFLEIPPEQFYIVDQEYALHMLKNRIPFNEE